MCRKRTWHSGTVCERKVLPVFVNTGSTFGLVNKRCNLQTKSSTIGLLSDSNALVKPCI